MTSKNAQAGNVSTDVWSATACVISRCQSGCARLQWELFA
ncbi:uncharacterized protein FFB20_15007 [Fusarium fujikuroi]|nr:uncharacterized protein FFC1_02312 [Fusarium fujikuroi]SCN87392.1 uncharacterized protein FFE2_06395 [Fusarium fujikuroi]SCN93905.1 uncharacterized protein FFM5_05844 [Fusarium fujikuroi]SCO16475.1 uncharacterized protein FFB20_15007 [Fusarium fujikuroi]SCO31081.1 uncharacterized protein FFNC_01773 [Fusarium fujikuroi]